MTAAMYVPQFVVRQKITMMVNRYQIFATNQDGSQGPLMALAEQKRMAFKEQVTFFTDESKSRPVFGFKARRKLDLNAGYDITDEQGQPIGFFKKDFSASLLRSTFHVEGPGYGGTGQERSQMVGAAAALHGLLVPAGALRLRRPPGQRPAEQQPQVHDR